MNEQDTKNPFGSLDDVHASTQRTNSMLASIEASRQASLHRRVYYRILGISCAIIMAIGSWFMPISNVAFASDDVSGHFDVNVFGYVVDFETDRDENETFKDFDPIWRPIEGAYHDMANHAVAHDTLPPNARMRGPLGHDDTHMNQRFEDIRAQAMQKYMRGDTPQDGGNANRLPIDNNISDETRRIDGGDETRLGPPDQH